MNLNKFWKKGNSIKFTVEGRPPKKSTGSCWGNKEVEFVFKLREKALEARTKAHLSNCLDGPVKLELIVYAPNITKRKDTNDYVSDLDTLIAGVMESIQPAPDNPDIKIDQIFQTRKDIGSSVPLIVQDDAQVVSIIAKKIESDDIHYSVVVEPI